MNMIKIAAAAALVAAVPVITACSGPAQQGKVTGWQYSPPSVQTVNTSCTWWSGGTKSSSSYCLSWNTKTLPFPQVCTLHLSSGAYVKTAVAEAQCKAMLGSHWPVGGGDMQ